MEQGNALAGDVSLAYYTDGAGGRALLLIMGLGGQAADWGPMPARLGERLRVITFDNRGTGASSKPQTSWTMSEMTGDALTVLDATGQQRASVLGFSMGGMVAQQLALNHPQRVERLLLLSTSFGGIEQIPPAPDVAALFAPTRGAAADQIVRERVRRITARGFAEARPDLVEELVRLALVQPTPRMTLATQLQAILSCEHAARLRSVRAPTLIIHGDLDPLVPIGNAERLQRAIPQARYEVLRGCGHLPMWEMPEQLLELIEDFLP